MLLIYKQLRLYICGLEKIKDDEFLWKIFLVKKKSSIIFKSKNYSSNKKYYNKNQIIKNLK